MNDVSGRSAATAKLPTVGPGFLTEEDAAYWVHTRIPAHPETEYGSVILRRPDGKFVATEPLPGEINRFDFSTLIEVDLSGDYVHPNGYVCVANVHSHPPSHDAIRKTNPSQDETAIRLFINFFSDMDFIADVAKRNFFRSAYLSGPDATLLKYSSSGSTDEFRYYLWLKAGADPASPDGAFGVVNIIKKVASLGELKVIVSNADWGGSLGKVPSDWVPGRPFSNAEPGDLPLMTRVCASAERAVLAALKFGGALTSGLVLKKIATQEYVATQARGPGLSSWDPGSFFARDSNGKLQLPTGYALEGFYYASRPDPANFPPDQPWLYEHFFTPQEMAVAIVCHARSKHLAAPDRPLSLYMQAMDSSMLKYSFSGSAAEAALSIENPDGTIMDAGLQARMLARTLRPQAFVSMLTSAGSLEVLRANPLWASVGPVARDWMPFAGFAWPTLGPAFLTADDAARYVHEQIGNRRDRQYAGYVLQRSDQRFTATEPLEGGIDTLRLGLLYPRDRTGRPIFPDAHVLHAHYVSHQALSLVDSARVQRLNWSRQEAALSVQMFRVEEMRQVLSDEIPLYLSGAENSLIGLMSVDTAAARELKTRLGETELPGPLVIALESGATRPAAFIREQAAAGRLNNLLDSDLWGARGQISPSWSPPSEPWSWRRPETVAFGAVFASADEAAQDRYARNVYWGDDERVWFGFILKHKDREEYVATELAPVSEQRNDVFQLQSVFGVERNSPWFRYPEDFNRHAFFYSRQRVRHPSGDPQPWLSQYFIAPDDLYTAVLYSRRRPVAESNASIPLYMSTQDGALLKYVRRKGSKLFDDDTANFSLNDIKANLRSGKLLPENLVQVVANSGELNVLRRSQCWDRAGPVESTWRPFMNLERRWLGPLFQSSDAAARDAGSRLPEHADKLYGGLILQRSDDLYLATVPIEVSGEDFETREIYSDASIVGGLFPSGCRVTGRYRIRVARELPVVLSEIEKHTYMNMLSVDTLDTAFTRQTEATLDEYLFGPDGSLIRYRAGLLSRLRAELAKALNDDKYLPHDLDGKTIKQLIHSGSLKPGVWVETLVKSGSLHVVAGSRLWGPPGPVTEWAPYPAAFRAVLDYARAVIDPVCSPAFVQADAAARHVHEASDALTTRTFGFILSSVDMSMFIATLPIDVQHSLLALDRVFAQARLPSGFALDSLYLCAQGAPEDATNDDFRRFFVPPIDVHQARERAYTPQGYKPVYFSCADGALLRYEMGSFEPGLFYDRHGQIELRPNTFASLEQATRDERDISRGAFDFPGYVRRMALAGKLEVIETSAYWSRHGQVGRDWRPRMADFSIDERWRANSVPPLGPVFQHGDDAARYAQQRANSAITIDAGYEGATLARTTLNRFVPLEPMAYSGFGESPAERIFHTANDPSKTWRDPPRYPEGYTLVASHQFHLSGNTTLVPDTEQVYANFASGQQVYVHTHALKNNGLGIQHYYFSTRHGVLIRYTPEYTHAEKELLLKEPVAFEGGQWVARLAPAELISRLGELGDFRVLVAGHYWQQTGRLGVRWKTRRQQPPNFAIVPQRDEL